MGRYNVACFDSIESEMCVYQQLSVCSALCCHLLTFSVVTLLLDELE